MLALAFSSCSSDVDEPAQNGNGDLYTIELQLPSDLQTRATNAYGDGQFGDGTKATALHFAVYEIGGQADPVYTEEDITNPQEFFKGQQSNKVTLRLVNGRQYEMICWADVPGNKYYTFNKDNNKSVTVDYQGLESNCENRDAFYGYAKIAANGAVTGAISQEIVLTRPFAQVNLGTDDLKNKAVIAAYGDDMKIEAKVDLDYNTLNLVSGEVTGDNTATDLTFSAQAVPDAKYKFPYQPDSNPTQYDYANMAYVLVPADRDAINVTYTFYKDKDVVTTLPVTNVPVQRNYRTNIFGSIFTSPAELTIKIDPIFTDPDIDYMTMAKRKEVLKSLFGTLGWTLKWSYTKCNNPQTTNYPVIENAGMQLAWSETNNRVVLAFGGFAYCYGTIDINEMTLTLDLATGPDGFKLYAGKLGDTDVVGWLDNDASKTTPIVGHITEDGVTFDHDFIFSPVYGQQSAYNWYAGVKLFK